MLHRAIVVACVLCSGAAVRGHRLRHDLHFYPASPLPLGHSGVRLCRKHRQRHNHRGRGKTGYAAATTKPKDATVLAERRGRRHRYRHQLHYQRLPCHHGRRGPGHRQQRGPGRVRVLLEWKLRSPFYLGSGGTTATILPSLTTQAAAYGINNSKQVVGEDDAVGAAV